MKKNLKIILIFFSFYFVFNINFIFAANNFIDIGLKFGSNAMQSVKIVSNGLVINKETENREVSAGAEFTIKAEPNGNISILDSSGKFVEQISSDDVISSIGNSTINVFNKNYRGGLRFINNNGALTVVNRVDIEHYLYGVLPSEMGANYEIEALKAQAIAARSYAIKNVNKYKKYGFNLTDDTRCQVYNGVGVESEKTNRAVNETSGLIGYYNDSPAELLYNASSGGATVSAEKIWGGSFPYLIDQKDRFSTSTIDWEYKISKSKIEEILNSRGKNIGRLKEIRIDSKSEYGYILSITFMGTDGNCTFKGDQIRGMFGGGNIKSQLFKIIGDAKSSNSIQENNEILNTSDSFIVLNNFMSEKLNINPSAEKNMDSSIASDVYIFKGSGHGHGVGMSQLGANNMAKEGYNYAEIIDFYYPGVKIR